VLQESRFHTPGRMSGKGEACRLLFVKPTAGYGAEQPMTDNRSVWAKMPPLPSFSFTGRGRPPSGGKLSFISRLYLPEVCHIRTFTANVAMRAKPVVNYASSSSSSAFASFRSGVPKPSVNQP
jgi:hypothetical protein